jgi:hypothetical protein
MESELSGRISAKAAGYMELNGAKKDGDCRIVNVKGGVSKQLGCCNKYQPQKGAQEFKCGKCEYIK